VSTLIAMLGCSAILSLFGFKVRFSYKPVILLTGDQRYDFGSILGETIGRFLLKTRPFTHKQNIDFQEKLNF
jgi:hypothetical protein